jgi:hypothetical protein
VVKNGGEEDVWKRGSFGSDPPLMGHTKPNTFLQKSVAVSFARHCNIFLVTLSKNEQSCEVWCLPCDSNR